MNLRPKKANIVLKKRNPFPIIHLGTILILIFTVQYPVSSSQYPAFRRWLDGTPDLIQRMRQLTPIDIKTLPSLAPDRNPPEVGDQRKFSAINFSGAPKPYLVDATCRAVGDFCYVFVEDKQWDNESVTYNNVLQLKNAFDETTPAESATGIYELESKNLGIPPDEIDHDPKIYILILDILDNFKSSGNYVAGYFDPMNQKAGVFQDFRTGQKFQSNEIEMIYMDCSPLRAGSDLSRLILAHEFQHMIHWRHDQDEDIWINEGCSDYAALYLCGYSERYFEHVEAFEDDPETSLVDWPPNMGGALANYGAAYLWMAYLHEQYGGVSTISSLIAQQLNGISGVDAVLSSRGYSQRFDDVFSDWKIANLIDNIQMDSGKYGYNNLDTGVKIKSQYSFFPVFKDFNLSCLAADYIEFTGGNGISDLKIELISRIYKFDIKLIMIKNGVPVAIESMEFSDDRASIAIPKFGDSVDTIILVPHWFSNIQADFNEKAVYSISAVLEEDVGSSIIVLPNAVHERYIDFIVQFVRVAGSQEETSQSPVTGIPRISIKRLGETVVSEENMVSVTNIGNKNKAIFVYQFYIPYGWGGTDVLWNISYMGKSLDNGNLDKILSGKNPKSKG